MKAYSEVPEPLPPGPNPGTLANPTRRFTGRVPELWPTAVMGDVIHIWIVWEGSKTFHGRGADGCFSFKAVVPGAKGASVTWEVSTGESGEPFI
jgi:hypothetical protein